MRSLAVTIAVTTLIAGCGGRAPTGAPAPPEGPQLVVVGDSLASGRFAGTEQDAFPQQVAAATHAHLELLGIPGATTAQLAAYQVPGGAKVAVVEAGTNDVFRQTPRRQFASDYKALLAKVTEASPGAKLVCLTVWIGARDAPRVKIPASAYNAAIRRACPTVVDIAPIADDPAARGPAGRSTFLGPGDAYHPNSDGHAAIARAIEAELP